MVRTSTYFVFCFLIIMSGLLSGQDTLQVRTEEEPAPAAIETETEEQSNVIPSQDSVQVEVETESRSILLEGDTLAIFPEIMDTLGEHVSQDSLQLEAVVKRIILVLETDMLGISDLEAQTLSEYIRSEIITTGTATTVSLAEIWTTFEEMGLAETGCSTDSCIQAVSGELNATHAIVWSLEKVEDRYRMDFKYLDVIDVISTKKRLSRKYSGNEDGLVIAIQSSIWDLLDVQPPKGRFPKEVTGIAAISQRIIEKRYLIGGVALVLVGAGIAIAVSGPEPPSEWIGLPPDWPEP